MGRHFQGFFRADAVGNAKQYFAGAVIMFKMNI